MEKVRQYRARAEELRTIAQDWLDHRAQMTLIELALQYERMAEDRERQLADIGATKLDGGGS